MMKYRCLISPLSVSTEGVSLAFGEGLGGERQVAELDMSLSPHSGAYQGELRGCSPILLGGMRLLINKLKNLVRDAGIDSDAPQL